MRDKIIATLPKTVVYIFDKEKTKKVYGETVIPVYVSDAENEKTRQSGRDWASNSNRWVPRDIANVEEIESTNSPKTGYKILSLEVRSDRGRAYKVMTPEGYYVDFREDVLLDVIFQTGISPGGVLNGEFLFARVGSEMKLIRFGSELYKKVVESTKEKSLTVLKNLAPGHIYSGRKGDRLLYLGKVDYMNPKVVRAEYHSAYNHSETVSKLEKVSNAMIFVEMYGTKSYKKLMTDDYVSFEIKKSHSFINDEGECFPESQADEILNMLLDREIKYCEKNKWFIHSIKFRTCMRHGKQIEIPEIILCKFPHLRLPQNISLSK
jgi:hypothetical protein